MIKLVIFDIDNTIMDFPKNFEVEFKRVLDKFVANIQPIELYKAVGTYETNKEGVYYTKEKLLEVVNKVLNLNLPLEFIDEFFNMYDVLISEINNSVIDTLKYLKSKYKIVSLSNWFTDSQKSRL